MNLDAEFQARLDAMTSRERGMLADELARRDARRRLHDAYPSPGALAAALDPNTIQTPMMDVLDSHLVAVDAGDITRLLITAPPQEGKSSRVSRWGSLWAMARNDNRRVGIVSYASELASGHGGWVRDMIEAHGLDAPLLGGTDQLGLRVNRASRSRSRWELQGTTGGMIAVGIGGGLTGKPIDWLNIDDPYADRQEADSIVTRLRVWGWWTDVALARAPRVIVVVMTRWHEDDMGGQLIKEDLVLPPDLRKWVVVNIPAQADPKITWPDPLGREAGQYLDSARGRSRIDEAPPRDEDFWITRKRNARTWSALYQGNPTPVEGGMFKWDWINPYRVAVRPELTRIVVAVDTTGGGSDEAGIVGAGRGTDGRTYVIADRSGPYTAGGQWRKAWLTCIELDADVLVYEKNLVNPIMRKAITAAWARMRDQAEALEAAGVLAMDLEDADPEVLDERVHEAAQKLVAGASGDDDVLASTDPLTAITAQLMEVLPYALRILAAPLRGPVRVEGVAATKGKTVRADPVSQAYETGQVPHVGVFPELEQELTTWQEGQPSPNRLDACVWAWVFLNTRGGAATAGVAQGALPVGTAAAIGGSGRR